MYKRSPSVRGSKSEELDKEVVYIYCQIFVIIFIAKMDFQKQTNAAPKMVLC